MKEHFEGAVRFVVPAAQADAVEENLFEGFGGIPLSAARDDIGDLSIWVQQRDAAEAEATLARMGIGGLTPFEEPPRDWILVASALRRSVVVDRYLLDPHDGDLATPATSGQTRLFLPAGRSFGTGSHESTRLAIRLLLEEDLRGRSVLDIGCGAGTLSFVASLEGAARSVAFDIDADAALATRLQGRANRIPRLLVFAGPLEALRLAARFEVIAANVILEEVAPLLPGMRVRLSPGGRLLCSGLLVEHRREWEDLLRKNGFRVVRAVTENEWLGTAAEFSE
jgi:ribosomal protein L11 methyltransferase